MKQSILFIVLLLSTFQSQAEAQEAHFGSCPTVQSHTGFEMQNFTGKWFEIMKFDSVFERGKCTSFNVKIIDDKHINMSLSQVLNKELSIESRQATVEKSGAYLFKFYTVVSEFLA